MFEILKKKLAMHRRARQMSGMAFGRAIHAATEDESRYWIRYENRAFRIGFDHAKPFRKSKTI